MKTNWNDGMDYSFSATKSMMWLLGVWPLQKNNLVGTIRWLLILIIESLTMINLLIESFKNCGDSKDILEVFLMIEAVSHGWTSVIFTRIYMKKTAINIRSAIDDWSSASTTESYMIMTSYARIGRIITLSQLMIGCLIGFFYFTFILIGNNQQVAIGNETDILWNFVIPATCLFKGISYTAYKVFFGIQVIQALITLISECVNDSFFFSITMHLCGQLEILRNRFIEIGKRINEGNHYEHMLEPWIKRHCQLIMLAKNIEDVFNISILFRLFITTVVIAISGMRILVSLTYHDYANVIKSVFFVHFFILQSFLLTHAGDTLQHQSESIVSVIYDTTWHTLPSTSMKNLILIMMRTKIPLRLSAGKFFYITRSTTTDILKTAMTYVSFLRVAMKI